jgi:hypothetical protein
MEWDPLLQPPTTEHQLRMLTSEYCYLAVVEDEIKNKI